jgi:hypothetical protein
MVGAHSVVALMSTQSIKCCGAGWFDQVAVVVAACMLVVASQHLITMCPCNRLFCATYMAGARLAIILIMHAGLLVSKMAVPWYQHVGLTKVTFAPRL